MAIISGTSALETLNGTSSADTIHGYGGNDIINGSGGDDLLYGNGGNDTLNGGLGNDVLYGGAGVDLFLFDTGGGQDTIKGFAAGEIVKVTGYTAAQSILQVGADVVVTLSATDKIVFSNSSLSTVQAGLQFGSGSGGGGGGGGGGTGTITGTAGNDILNGTAGNDVIQGLAGNDQLIGGPGNDQLYGGAGDDWIRRSASDGSDQIYGDLGADYLELTIGDVVHYSSYQQSGAGFGIDTVATMQRSDPWTLDFTGFDANLDMAGQQKLVFIGTNSHPGTGQLAVITSNDFLHLPIGIGANLDSDPELEFFVRYTWEFQANPTLII